MKLEQAVHKSWHRLSPEAALAALETTRSGLDEAEAAIRLAAFGENVLPRRKRPGMVEIYLRQFKSPLIYLLLAAAAVSWAIGEAVDALFIFLVLQINAVIGTIQEWKAETGAEALDKMIRNWAIVIRGGNRHQLDAAGLVPGDVVFLESGSMVPADIRLLSARDLRADESLLTGESLPVEKNTPALDEEHPALGDRRNVLHAGTSVISGRALGVVTLTGIHTELGRIAQALAHSKTPPPPLVVRLEKFTRSVGQIVITAVAILAFSLFLKGMNLYEVFYFSVALVVSAIPEGLPVAITVALAVGSARMARRNVVIRSLPAVEGLGACTLIASDKTGTLTCNELTVKRLLPPSEINYDGEGIRIEGEGYAARGGLLPAEGLTVTEEVLELAAAGALCNEATYREEAEGPVHFGDTVDVAFLVLATKLGLERDALLDETPEVDLIPFEPSQRFAASFNQKDGSIVAQVKGAAETVLPMCEGIDRDAVLERAERLAAAGYRVLALAMGPVAETTPPLQWGSGERRERLEHALSGLKFLGLVGLIDPLRPEVPAAIQRCREAGVEVKMITGDHPATALSIARDLEMGATEEQVVTGGDIAELGGDEAGLDNLAASALIFARVEPVQKLDIVHALQRNGHFVAVSGDGVNDAPALKAAHIGVAMGKSGTDVARGASDMIISDDNFTSIVNGIEEGRIAYDNVRKVVYLLISTGAAEIVLFFLALVAGLPLPLFAAQLLWLNLVTNGIQDVALAFEKGEAGVLKRSPRPPGQPIFNRLMIEQSVVSGVYIGVAAFVFFKVALVMGMDEFQARNVLLLLMVLFENAHVFNCRSERLSAFRVPLSSNWLLVIAVAAAQSIHIAAMYIPGLNDVLRIQPVDLKTWLTVVPLALGVIAVMEIYKLFKRR